MGANSVTRTEQIPAEHRVVFQAALDDYKTLRTGSPTGITQEAPGQFLHSDRIDPSVAPHPRAPVTSSPPKWPTKYRRIPPYSPVNHTLDMSERPTGDGPMISFFLVTVFCGCTLISTYASMWRPTLGRFTHVFRYEIGGEF
ncbi:hypothetical protein BJY01DRAFT_254924 [Aspergillus pseudoustus]|uniref:Uncharacterized protein n=1 Tax=Aspergillus pseudoustus TaxID=1810923 RepID=A0ABR4IPD6_9EURO